jgi:cell division protein FtsI/penicillin-binding protein 2
MFVVMLAVIIGRLFEIQIIHGGKYAAESRKQTKQRTVIEARRGAIRDRSGTILASSITAGIAQQTGQRAGTGPSRNTAYRRIYPHGELAAAVLGYVGVDGYGLGGIEYAFDRQLRGHNGWSILQRDGINNRYARIDMPQRPTVDGADVFLNLDIHVQTIAENILRKTVENVEALGGMCIVMEARSGKILAMANAPGFDPNNAMSYAAAQRTNQCISYNYEPGSTFKLITAASALEEGILREADTIDGNQGVYEIYDESIRDHKPYGKLSFLEALSYSSNVCFAKIADELGSQSLYRYTKDFGFGAKAGIELPGEESGIVHPVENWSGRTHVTMAIGQEISVTLLQMMLVFSAIANDGVLITPRICSRIVGPDGRIRNMDTPQKVRQVISKKTARRTRVMLKSVVAYGTGKRAAIPGISVAGKTGTSQKIDTATGEYSLDRVWASFIGFAPADNPALICGVVIDEPAGGDFGGAAAAPAFRAILSQIISHPELEFAERIIESPLADTGSRRPAARRVPDVCGMDREKAVGLLRAEKIAFEVIGAGGRICNQSPEAGGLFSPNAGLILYTRDAGHKAARGVRMPDCTGKDLRDAINALNIKGLKPFVSGAGAVHRQYPTAGVVVRSSAVCTLYCSFDG